MANIFTSTKKTSKKSLYIYLNLIILIFALSFICCGVLEEDSNDNEVVNENIPVCNHIKDSSDNKACFNNFLSFISL